MFMEYRYKAALRNIYKAKLTNTISSNYREHLFPVGWSYAQPNEEVVVQPKVKSAGVDSKKLINSSQENIEPGKAEVKTSEKEQVIGSLNEFTKSLLEETQTDSVVVGNIEISKKDSNSTFDAITESSKSELETQLVSFQGEKSVTYRYKSNESLNRFELDKLKVIFVSDTLRSAPHEDDNTELHEFYALFDEQTAILFSKMVKAMKVKPSEYLLTAITYGEDEANKGNNTDMVLKEIASYRPDLVITLGVSSSHALLESKQRLKDLHGNFYGLTIGDFKTEVMPLFSPSLLKSAPHMKSITWIDMQKAMEKLV